MGIILTHRNDELETQNVPPFLFPCNIEAPANDYKLYGSTLGVGVWDNEEQSYKIPVSTGVASDTTTTPVYIGEDMLYDNEYVHYSEQKIYKKINGALTPIDPPIPLPSIPLYTSTTLIDEGPDTERGYIWVKYSSWEETAIKKIQRTKYNETTQEYDDTVLYDDSNSYKTLEGVPPITFTSNGRPLMDWTIWGNTGGVGEPKTENILPPQSDAVIWKYVDQHISPSGVIINEAGYSGTDYLPAFSGELSFTNTSERYSSWYRIGWFDANKSFISHVSSYTDHATVEAPSGAEFMMIAINKDAINIKFLIPSAGYVIPVSIAANALPQQSDTNVWIYADQSVNSNGNLQNDTGYITTDYIPAFSGSFSFVKTSSASSWYRVCWYDANKTYLSNQDSYSDHGYLYAPSAAEYMRVSCNFASQVLLDAQSYATAEIDIGLELLEKDEFVSFTTNGTVIATAKGENVLSVNTAVLPEKILIKYKGGESKWQ